MTIPRPEHPRPDFRRENWINLNGEWKFSFDDDKRGEKEEWFRQGEFAKTITVPYPFQSELSGIGETGFHDVFWYGLDVDLPESWPGAGRVLLHVGAFDYSGTLWINGEEASRHRGGYTPWTSDITDCLKDDKAAIVIRGMDEQNTWQPRGKQYWKEKSEGIFYTRVSGIWQTVWLELVPEVRIQSFHILPKLDPDRFIISVELCGQVERARMECSLKIDDAKIADQSVTFKGNKCEMIVEVPDARRWSPDDPALYDMELILQPENSQVDKVMTYGGLREVSTSGRNLLLNGKPIRFKSVLDQGYFPGGIYTAGSDEELKRDVELTLALGFNGSRKHQKVEDPRWYYWCDRLGLLVWGEMGNSWEFSEASCEALRHEWPEVMKRDWNHPCIITWVPINESWGVPEVADDRKQQEFLSEMADLTRKLDPSRPVSDNSGWSHINTDIIDLHNYTADPKEMSAFLDELLKTGRADKTYKFHVWVGEAKDEGQPIMVSEYGGIAMGEGFAANAEAGQDWGYGRSAGTPEELLERFRNLTRAILDNSEIAGYTYTQLTDVEQEVNGLLTFERKPKAKLDKFREAQQE